MRTRGGPGLQDPARPRSRPAARTLADARNLREVRGGAILVGMSLAVLALALPLHTAPPAPTPIVGGEEVGLSEWPAVVAILAQQSASTANLCSGTLIAPKVILTAAHCLVDDPDVDEMRVIFGDTIYTNDTNRIAAVERYAAYPTACVENCRADAYDFGYVILEPDISGVEPIAPITDQDEWDATMRVGRDITVVGFGTTGEDKEGGVLSNSDVGQKRRMTTPIDSFSASGLEFRAGGEGQDACGGDSGGPALVQIEGGAWRLAGVTSRGVRPCGTGDSVYGVPYPVLAWIRDETGVDLLPKDCPEGDCLATEQPEERGCSVAPAPPPGGALLALLAPLFIIRRRRRS